MQKMKALLLLPALFIFSYTMGSDKTQTGSDSFKSFEDIRATGSDIQPLIPRYGEGISSGSGDDACILPDSPESPRSKKPIIPKFNLIPRKEADQEKQQNISQALALLQQQTPDSTRRASYDDDLLSERKTSKRRVLSQGDLPIISPQTSRRTKSTERSPDLAQKLQPVITQNVPQQPLTPFNTPEKSLTPKTGSTSISQHQSTGNSPQISPRNVIAKTHTEPEASSSSSDQETTLQTPGTPSPIHTPSPRPMPSASPRTATLEKSVETLKTPDNQTNSQEKKDDTKINNPSQETNPTSMRPLTWKDGGTALLTIAGLLSLLYYLDKLPANISAKIDNLLALLRMNG